MDKKTIAAVGLIILVIGVYNLFIIPKFSPPPPPEKAGAPTAQTAAPAASPSRDVEFRADVEIRALIENVRFVGEVRDLDAALVRDRRRVRAGRRHVPRQGTG
ncbi:MAG TPA: hypothetical protein VI078_07175, partial [bacterium]